MFDQLESFNFGERAARLLAAAAERHGAAPGDCHVGHLLLEALYEEPDFVHQIDAATDERQTNASAAVRSSRLASALRRRGLRPGDRVVVMAPNTLDVAMAFYACHYEGLAVCPMDPSNDRKDIAAIFSDVQPKLVFCTRDKEEDIQFALSSGGGLSCTVVSLDGKYDVDSFVAEHGGTADGYSPGVFPRSLAAWLLLTSGTTGRPKLAVIPYGVVNAVPAAYWGNTPVRLNVTLAMATVQWLSTVVLLISTPLLRSTRVQTSKQIDTKHIAEIINKYKPQFTVFTPHILRQFLHGVSGVGNSAVAADEGDAVGAGCGCDLSCFVCIVLAGSVVPSALFEQLQEKIGGFVVNAYGMTELVVPVFRYIPGVASEGSVGTELPSIQCRLVDDDGHDISEPNKVGELWVKGDNFFEGYLNNPAEEAAMRAADGWVRTGDLFYRDERRCYHFAERRRLLIKYMSRFVAPLELEAAVRRAASVADACVVGVPHADAVQVPTAAIVPRRGASVRPADVFRRLREELPKLKQLHGGLFFVEALPVTPSGKVDRRKVLQMALAADRVLPRDVDQ